MTIMPGNSFTFSTDYGKRAYVSVARSRPYSFWSLSKAELRTELEIAGLPVSGNKSDMRDRLIDYGVKTETYSWARISRPVSKNENLAVYQRIFKSPLDETDSF